MKGNIRTGAVVTISVVAALLGACAVALARITDADAAIVAMASAAGALMLMPLWRGLWRRLTGIMSAAVAFAGQLLTGTVLLMCAFYAANILFASDDVTVVPAVTELVYSEERHHKRRVGRGRYVNGDAYHVYKADVRLAGGWRTEIALSPGEFTQLHAGDTVMMRVRRGGFGFNVSRGRDGK